MQPISRNAGAKREPWARALALAHAVTTTAMPAKAAAAPVVAVQVALPVAAAAAAAAAIDRIPTRRRAQSPPTRMQMPKQAANLEALKGLSETELAQLKVNTCS